MSKQTLDVYAINTPVRVFDQIGKITAITIREFNYVTYEVSFWDKVTYSKVWVERVHIDPIEQGPFGPDPKLTQQIGFINAQ